MTRMPRHGFPEPRAHSGRTGYGRLRGVHMQGSGHEEARSQGDNRGGALVRFLPGPYAADRLLSGEFVLRLHLGLRPLDRVHPAGRDRSEHDTRGLVRRGGRGRRQHRIQDNAGPRCGHEHRCPRSGDIPGDDGRRHSVVRSADRHRHVPDLRCRCEDRKRVR